MEPSTTSRSGRGGRRLKSCLHLVERRKFQLDCHVRFTPKADIKKRAAEVVSPSATAFGGKADIPERALTHFGSRALVLRCATANLTVFVDRNNGWNESP